MRPEAGHADVVRAIGPRAVSSTVLLRLARLPADAAAVARAVAVLGESAALPAVAALAGLRRARVAAATGELSAPRSCGPEPPLGFVHPLVRDAVYHELPPARARARARGSHPRPLMAQSGLLSSQRKLPLMTQSRHCRFLSPEPANCLECALVLFVYAIALAAYCSCG